MKSGNQKFDGFISLALLIFSFSSLFAVAALEKTYPYAVILSIVLIAFTIGFGISGLRQSGRANRICAIIGLFIPITLFILAAIIDLFGIVAPPLLFNY